MMDTPINNETKSFEGMTPGEAKRQASIDARKAAARARYAGNTKPTPTPTGRSANGEGVELTATSTPANSNDEAPKRKHKPTIREICERFYCGYRFDSFTGALYDADGNRTDIDTEVAKLCRLHDEVSLDRAVAECKIAVIDNPARRFDELKSRIERLAGEYDEARDGGAIARYCARVGFDEYETRRVHLWLYQLCGRALVRGEKCDGMLVLAGKAEGTHKTSFFDGVSLTACGSRAAAFNFGAGKDCDLLLARVPVVVIDELDKVGRRTDVAELKTRITQSSSRVRAPYDRGERYRLNAAIFGATTNDEKPIPAGEGEARRYWVVRVQKDLSFTNSAEVEGMMREAAHMTKAGLDEVGDKLDPLIMAGKVWVQTKAEEAETATRNAGLKHDDNAALAIVAMLHAVAPQAKKVQAWERPIGVKAIAVAVETGDASALGINGLNVTWGRVQTKAADVRRLIGARNLTGLSRYGGKVMKGYRLCDLAWEFNADE